MKPASLEEVRFPGPDGGGIGLGVGARSELDDVAVGLGTGVGGGEGGPVERRPKTRSGRAETLKT